MLWFDFEFMKLAASLSIAIEMYKRYVDDINLVCRGVKKTIRYDPVERRLIDDSEEGDEEVEKKNDEEMMQLLREIANSVTKMVTWEADWPGNHGDQGLPVLDLRIQLDIQDKQELLKHD